MKLTIAHDTIKALLMIAAKQDVRYYLKGILIDVRASDITLVATNGHVMLAVPVESTDIEEPTIGQYIVDRAMLDAVKPVKVGRNSLPITLTIGSDGACSVAGATTASGKLVDGFFPNWRRVMPATCSGEAGQYDPAYYGLWGDVRALLTGNSKAHPIIHQNGLAGAARISHLGRNAIGVMMPLRVDAVDLVADELPAWARRLDA
jgi:DNA polymerase-3 subunit beta